MKQTVSRVHIALNFPKVSVDELITLSTAVASRLASDPDAIAPPVPSAALAQQTNELQATHILRKTDRSPTLTRLEEQQGNALVQSLASDAHYVEDTANTLANGDVAKAQQIITRTGFQLKKIGQHHPRSFEVVEAGEGWVHLRVKKSRTGNEAHAWRYGVTTAKDTPPAELSQPLMTLETDVILRDLKSSTVYGFQHASILPASHTRKTSPASTATRQAATLIPTTKAHHPLFSDGNDPQQWSGFIYTVIP
ncbi:MAG: hypothetical protein PHE55_04005 [Methylococcaceae bacterium]|nr:hypothetical protein [Methylococcaceae bacterium]